MIGKPMTAAQWDDAFRTSAGEKIVRTLMPFHERPPELGNAGRLVDAIISVQLEAIGQKPSAVNVLSVVEIANGACETFNMRSDSLRDRVVAAFAEEVRCRQKRRGTLGDMLDDWYAVTRAPRDGKGLSHEVATTLHRTLLRDLQATMPFAGFLDSAYLTYVRNFGILRCLTYQVASLITGDEKAVEAVSPFTEWFAKGINPLLSIDDDTFIVVAA